MSSKIKKLYNDIDFTSIKKNFEIFHKKLNEIQNIEKNDKIGFDSNDCVYVIKESKIQPIIRWFYNQSRENTINTLKMITDEYVKLLHMIQFCDLYIRNMNEYSDKINYFNENILSGLENLYQTYSNDQKTQSIIKEIIENIDFYIEA